MKVVGRPHLLERKSKQANQHLSTLHTHPGLSGLTPLMLDCTPIGGQARISRSLLEVRKHLDIQEVYQILQALGFWAGTTIILANAHIPTAVEIASDVPTAPTGVSIVLPHVVYACRTNIGGMKCKK